MYKGIVNEILFNGDVNICLDKKNQKIICSKDFVRNYKIEKGDFLEFEFKFQSVGKRKNYIVTLIKKKEPLFEMALKISSLSPKEYDEFCDLAKEYVGNYFFKNSITTSKLRNIFSAVQKAKAIKEIKLLRPKLAYLGGRDTKTKFFMEKLDYLIKQITTEEEVENFKQFFEAIVCYKRELEK